MDSVVMIGEAPELKAKLAAIYSSGGEIGIRKMSMIELVRLNIGVIVKTITITFTYGSVIGPTTTWTPDPATLAPIVLNFTNISTLNDLLFFRSDLPVNYVSTGGVFAPRYGLVFWSAIENNNYVVYGSGPIASMNVTFTNFENILPSEFNLIDAIGVKSALYKDITSADNSVLGTLAYSQPYLQPNLSFSLFQVSLPIFPKIRLPLFIKSSLPITSITNTQTGALNLLETVTGPIYEPRNIAYKKISDLNNFSLYLPNSLKGECVIQIITRKMKEI